MSWSPVSRSEQGSAAPAGWTFLAACLLGISCALCGCGMLGSYGPPQDHSRFAGVVLMPDRTVLISFSHLVYRPAAGITAFPDGGVPKYLVDEAVLAAYHIPSDTLRILRREHNKRWAAGQGRFGLQGGKGTVALVTQAGQLRADLSAVGYEDWFVDASTGAFRPVDWRTALAELGRSMTERHLVDTRGTLLFVTTPTSPAQGAPDGSDVWLWIRTPAGKYVKVARTPHYEGTEGDALIYWIPETRRFMAFDVVTHETRDLPGYRVPPVENVVEGVIVESGGQRLRYGRHGEGGWVYEDIPFDMGRLK